MVARERIAVTGVGIVSALGHGARTTFRALCSGARGFQQVGLFDVCGLRATKAAQVAGLSVADVAPAHEVDAWSRSDALAVLAASEALTAAHVAPRSAGLALCVGGTTGGMYEAEGVLASLDDLEATSASARRLLSYPLSTSAERISTRLGPVERALTVCSACSSGAVAIVQGAAWLWEGRARYALAGGTDGLCQLTFTGFNALGAMDPDMCRPFDRDRAGLSLGEGAGFLLLELESSARQRRAPVLAWLTGWGARAEAHHITHPEPTGTLAARMIEQALHSAGRGPADVTYVNAHGTGTIHNDAMESQALGRALGAEATRVRVSSSKGQIGHTLGAAGAIEAAITVLSVADGVMPGTGGLVNPDPSLALRHVRGSSESAELRCALSNSFGFGGSGCVLLFENAELQPAASGSGPRSHVVITGLCAIGPLGVFAGVDSATYATSAELTSAADPALDNPVALLDPARSRRFDAHSALVTHGAERVLCDAGCTPDGTGLVAGTAYGNVERSVAFLKRVRERGARFANPAEFPHLVPSAASGNASIYLGLTGPVVSVSDLSTSAEAACELALGFIACGVAERVIAGAAEPMDPVVARVLSPMHSDLAVDARGGGAAFLLLEDADAARARGAHVYARIQAWIAHWGPAEQALERLPALEAKARRVVIGTLRPELLRALGNSSWRDVPRRHVAERAQHHEALGGMALAAGAALLEREALDAVLVCGSGRERVYLAVLTPPAPGSP